MTNQHRPQKLEDALAPLLDGKIELHAFRMHLNEMFSSAVSNAPDDELDNYTARRLTPVYLALLQTLENLQLIEK